MTQNPNSSLERLVEKADINFDACLDYHKIPFLPVEFHELIREELRVAYTTGYNAGLADERKARELDKNESLAEFKSREQDELDKLKKKIFNTNLCEEETLKKIKIEPFQKSSCCGVKVIKRTKEDMNNRWKKWLDGICINCEENCAVITESADSIPQTMQDSQTSGRHESLSG